jgi:uncharacterized LabA/DUF88 family protein
MPEHVAVMVDYQNVHLTGHELYGRGRPLYEAVPNPSRLADVIAAKRNPASEVTAIQVYRGYPHPVLQPIPAAANDAQAAAWSRDERVTIKRRPLNYRGWPDLAPQEKGIDVQLAIDLVAAAQSGNYDAVILFSGDTDLLPAVEMVWRVPDCRMEVACWVGAKALRLPGTNLPWCYFLGEPVWERVCEGWKGRV